MSRVTARLAALARDAELLSSFDAGFPRHADDLEERLVGEGAREFDVVLVHEALDGELVALPVEYERRRRLDSEIPAPSPIRVRVHDEDLRAEALGLAAAANALHYERGV